VFWSSIGAAGADATLAGVLAGLLIAAAAALIVQWYQGSDAHTIALFGSGVPVLGLSTFLFTVIAGMDLSYTDDDAVPVVCSVLWSQWLLAVNVLFIGTAILVCGLGWALVSYGDTLAVRLLEEGEKEKNVDIDAVRDRRRFFIHLNAWLSGTIITASIGILVVTNELYLKAVAYPYKSSNKYPGIPDNYSGNIIQYLNNALNKIQNAIQNNKIQNTIQNTIQLHHERYLIFLVYLFGVYLVGRASYVVIIRTRSALRENNRSCAAYDGTLVAADSGGADSGGADSGGADSGGRKSLFVLFAHGGPVGKDPRFSRRTKLAIRAAQEFVVVMWVALSALLAVYLTSEVVIHRAWGGFSGKEVTWIFIGVVAVYVLIAGIVELLAAKEDDAPADNEAVPPANAESVERIRIDYNFGMLTVTIYGVVLFVVLATFLVVALTQLSLGGSSRIIISLLLGGLYPALILTGLSSSVPAGEDVRLPKWEIVVKRMRIWTSTPSARRVHTSSTTG
jgi:hypothetical protein